MLTTLKKLHPRGTCVVQEACSPRRHSPVLCPINRNVKSSNTVMVIEFLHWGNALGTVTTADTVPGWLGNFLWPAMI